RPRAGIDQVVGMVRLVRGGVAHGINSFFSTGRPLVPPKGRPNWLSDYATQATQPGQIYSTPVPLASFRRPQDRGFRPDGIRRVVLHLEKGIKEGHVSELPEIGVFLELGIEVKDHGHLDPFARLQDLALEAEALHL